VRTAEAVAATPVDPSSERSGWLGNVLTTAASAAGLAAVFYVISLIFGESESWDSLGAFVVGPGLFALTIPLLSRQAKRENDKTLMTILVAALALKLLGTLVRYFVGTNVYGGGVDATAYDRAGTTLAEGFRAGNFAIDQALTGTGFIELLTGIVYTIIGPSIIGGFMVFSWLAFLGLFMFYRAFVIAVPEGRKRTYATFIFFLPSFLFWPSSIGKESFMTFCLGIIALGAAHLLTGKIMKGLPIAAIGLYLAALPRAHIAGIAGVAIGVGFVLRRTSPEHRAIGPIVKLVSVALVLVAAVFFVGRASQFVEDAGVSTEGGLAGTLQEIADRTGGGKSNFEAPALTSPGRAPLAIFTVLFRPTIADAHAPTALLAAGEGTFVLLLTLVRFGWIMSALRLIRRRPYVAFSIAMVGALILAFSAVSNLGVLARERVQLLPFYFVLLSVPSKGWIKRREQAEEQEMVRKQRLGLEPA
jgi:hypothetical protein